MTDEGVREYFNRTALKFSANYGRGDEFDERRRVWGRCIDKALARLGDQTLCLDVGCGDGSLSRAIAARGVRTIGIDQSRMMLALAKHRAQHDGVSEYVDYQETSVPFRPAFCDQYDGRVGLILCSSVLEYIDDYRRVVEQFYGLLEPGGWLVVSVPNRDSIYRLCERVRKRLVLDGNSYLQHQRSQFRAGDFRSLLAEFGFRVAHDEYFALPLHKYSSRIVGERRSRWLATLYLVAARKE
jgi:2-polyprenyl-3-methyl-5-hydroxy-6-metoxy-1,4-benzoquinol methylase